MTDGRGWRFALEVAFLVALAVVLGVADVTATVIVGIMLAGWVLVALLEWAAWREEPHWGSGSPPRYYVPPTTLPPRRPVDAGYERGYPAQQRETESPTWIATPEMRREALADWPLPAPEAEAPPDEPAPEPEPEPEPELEPAAAAVDPEPEAVAEPAAAVAEPEPEDEPLEDALLQEAAAVTSLEDAPVEAEEDPAAQNGDTAAGAGNGADPWEVQAFPHGGEHVVTTARPSRHRIDPLAEPAEGRRWPWQRRDGEDGAATAEFPARPRHGALPRREADA